MSIVLICWTTPPDARFVVECQRNVCAHRARHWQALHVGAHRRTHRQFTADALPICWRASVADRVIPLAAPSPAGVNLMDTAAPTATTPRRWCWPLANLMASTRPPSGLPRDSGRGAPPGGVAGCRLWPHVAFSTRRAPPAVIRRAKPGVDDRVSITQIHTLPFIRELAAFFRHAQTTIPQLVGLVVGEIHMRQTAQATSPRCPPRCRSTMIRFVPR